MRTTGPGRRSNTDRRLRIAWPAILAFLLLVPACARVLRVVRPAHRPPPVSAPAPPPEAAAPAETQPAVPPPPAASPPPAIRVPDVSPGPRGVLPDTPLPLAPRDPALNPVGGPMLLRVGLATDLPHVVLPCCDAAVETEIEGETVAVSSPVRVEPATPPQAPGRFRVQVAALKDEGQAHGLARTLAERTSEPAEAVFDAKTDLYRVRVGRFESRAQAEALQTKLAGLGVDPTFIAAEGSATVGSGLRVIQNARVRIVPGRWVSVSATGEGGLRVEGRRYRGRVMVYLNDRGLLNVINELPLESYLRGVVPRELGPKAFNQLEALKAQAVAARTYAVRNLGEFATEGYDICATPRCQVYGGIEDEDPLSDQAIAETVGELVLYQGEPADALYSSTCGGHTEDVENVFPLKHAPYLRAVPCLEAGASQLGGALPRGTAFPAGLLAKLLPAGTEPTLVARVHGRLRRLAELSGLPPHTARLESLEPRAVQAAIAQIFDLAADAELFVAPEDVAYLVPEPPPGWSPAELRLSAYFAKTGLLPPPGHQALSADAIETLLLRLAVHVGVLREEEVTFRRIAEGRVTVADRDGERDWLVTPGIATFRSHLAQASAADLVLLPGDKLKLYWYGDSVAAVVQDVLREGAAYDRTSNRASWTRWRSDAELGASVRTRYPGFQFSSFEVVRRGRSGRVAEIKLLGTDGSVVTVEGLAVRWTLDIPDTWFTARRTTPKGKPAGWLFTGRGWGHGVGVCQVGAYGMALRGHDYRAILQHYYSGVTIGPLAR